MTRTEERKEYERKWRKDHPEVMAARQRANRAKRKLKDLEAVQAKDKANREKRAPYLKNYLKDYNEKNAEKLQAARKAKYAANPELFLERARKWRQANQSILTNHALKKAGWTREEFEAQMKEQDGCCWICRREFLTECILHKDHCHDTGKRRGFLCRECNIMEGMLKKSPLGVQEFATRLTEYLAHFE